MQQQSNFFSPFGSAWFSASSDRLHVQRWRENGGTVVENSSSYVVSDVKIVFCDGRCDPLYAKLKDTSTLIISSSWISCSLNLGHIVSFDPFILSSKAPSLLTPLSFGRHGTCTVLAGPHLDSAYTCFEPSTTANSFGSCSTDPENKVMISCVAKVIDKENNGADRDSDEEEERIVKCLIGLDQDEPFGKIKVETSPDPSTFLAKTFMSSTIQAVKVEEGFDKDDFIDPRLTKKKRVHAKLRSGLTLSSTVKEKTRAKRHLKNLITRSI
ncbi:BRCT domain [Phaffia rhodozyma]|uniref:BRCT domain n=1 Tax=Phaffia rhodozyma TaxID=264483 RepID=A0A0F7SFH1_PHARH|nr:BRCT domain [Phaffia rhodozyma]